MSGTHDISDTGPKWRNFQWGRGRWPTLRTLWLRLTRETAKAAAAAPVAPQRLYILMKKTLPLMGGNACWRRSFFILAKITRRDIFKSLYRFSLYIFSARTSNPSLLSFSPNYLPSFPLLWDRGRLFYYLLFHFHFYLLRVLNPENSNTLRPLVPEGRRF